MANILSQDEVDALLDAVERGDLAEDADDQQLGASHEMVVEYNFRRPNVISREQLRAFNALHEDFARELQGNLSILLRTSVDIRLVSTDRQLYNEFILSLSDITHMMLFSMEPLPGTAVMEINLSLVFGMVDLLLGGGGAVESAIRKLTDVETAILEPIIERIFNQLKTSWSYVLPVENRQLRTESGPEYVQAAPAEAPVVVLTFDAKIGQANGIINICYPLPMVEATLRETQHRGGQFDSYYGKSHEGESVRDMFMSLMNVNLQLRADLGSTTILAGELLKLRPGDVLVLDKKRKAPVEVKVEQFPMFRGIPGRFQRALSIKLTERIENKDNSDLTTLLSGAGQHKKDK